MVAQIYLAPYCTPALNVTQATALLANTLTLFVGLMLIIDYNMEAEAIRAGDDFDTVGRSVISVIIVIVNLGVLVIPFAVYAVQSDMTEKKSSCTGRKGNDLDMDDNESNDRELAVDIPILSPSQPIISLGSSRPVESQVASSFQGVFPMPTRLISSIDESTDSSRCFVNPVLQNETQGEPPWALNLVYPVLNVDSNDTLQGNAAPIVNEGDCLETLTFKTNMKVLNKVPTPMVTEPVEMNQNPWQLTYLRQWSQEEAANQLGTRAVIHSDLVLQQAINESEGYPVMQEFPIFGANSAKA